MPVPFGVSPGDFIAAIDLVHAICEALRSSTGSSEQYRGVVSALQSLKDALEQLHSINATDEEKLRIGEIVDRAKQSLLRFDGKIRKYDAALGESQTRAWWRSLPKKIQWQRYSSDDIRCLQNELSQHSHALQVLLAKIQNVASARACEQADAKLLRLEVSIDRSAEASQLALQETEKVLCARLDRSRTDTQSRFDEAEAIAAVRFERSESMATTRFRLSEAAAQTRFNVLVAVALHIYRDIMRGLFLVCTCMFQHINLLQRILAEIPRSVPTLGATIFEDAHGCIVHISIDFIQSWDSFFYVLKDNFRDRPGLRRVLKKQYQLYDRYGSRNINFSQPFRSAFRPGRHIRQSILFKSNEVSSESCPKCKTRQAAEAGTEIRCENTECGFIYRKLKEPDQNNDSRIIFEIVDDANAVAVPGPPADSCTQDAVDEDPVEDLGQLEDLKPVEDSDKPEDFARIVIAPDRSLAATSVLQSGSQTPFVAQCCAAFTDSDATMFPSLDYVSRLSTKDSEYALHYARPSQTKKSASAVGYILQFRIDNVGDEATKAHLERILIRDSTDIQSFFNEPDAHGVTPLHLAVAYGLFQTCGLLMKYGANHEARTLKGTCISHFAKPAQRLAGKTDEKLYFNIMHCRKYVRKGKIPPIPDRDPNSKPNPKKRRRSVLFPRTSSPGRKPERATPSTSDESTLTSQASPISSEIQSWMDPNGPMHTGWLTVSPVSTPYETPSSSDIQDFAKPRDIMRQRLLQRHNLHHQVQPALTDESYVDFSRPDHDIPVLLSPLTLSSDADAYYTKQVLEERPIFDLNHTGSPSPSVRMTLAGTN